jgi:cellulose synthase/poly-beta-1,6-N-acetylglucosamine synthase-like glycosyltransferase
MLGNPFSGEAAEGMGLYWRIEKIVRELESCSGSVVGATGALYVARRELLEPVPAGMILDDVYIPMQVVKHGSRVVFDGRARAWDTPNLGARREFARKVRTLTGNYQLLQLAPWLLGPGNKIRFEFVNHKLSRLAVPFALAGLMLSSMLAAGSIYLLALCAQLAFYAAGVIATLGLQLGPFSRVAGASRTFIVLNAAAAVAFANFVTGREAAWVPIKLPARDGSRREAQS